MRIRWHGHACFEIDCQDTVLVTDPHDGDYIGIRPPKVKGDVIFISHEHFDHNKPKVVSKAGSDIVTGAGEGVIRGVEYKGIPSFHDEVKGEKRGENTIFIMEVEGLSLVHLGDLGEIPSVDVIKQLKGCDILFIPVGGTFTLDGPGAWKFTKMVEPKVVVPMHYRVAGLSLRISDLDPFLNEVGDTPVTRVGNAIEFTGEDMPDTTTVWVFSL